MTTRDEPELSVITVVLPLTGGVMDGDEGSSVKGDPDTVIRGPSVLELAAINGWPSEPLNVTLVSIDIEAETGTFEIEGPVSWVERFQRYLIGLGTDDVRRDVQRTREEPNGAVSFSEGRQPIVDRFPAVIKPDRRP